MDAYLLPRTQLRRTIAGGFFGRRFCEDSFPPLSKIRSGRSKTEVALEVVEVDASVLSIVRQRIQSVQEIEPVFQCSQGFKIGRRHQDRDGLAIFAHRYALASELNPAHDLGEVVGDFRSGQVDIRNEASSHSRLYEFPLC